MPTLLKQFSFEDKTEIKKDHLVEKYITNTSPTEVFSKKKIENKFKKTDKKIANHLSKQEVARKYFFQLPTLFLGVLLYWFAFMILRKIQPGAIKDLLLPNTFLVLVLEIGLGHFFLLWYITQNFRRSGLLAFILSIIFMLRLHHIGSLLWIIIFCGPILLLELLLTYRTYRR